MNRTAVAEALPPGRSNALYTYPLAALHESSDSAVDEDKL